MGGLESCDYFGIPHTPSGRKVPSGCRRLPESCSRSPKFHHAQWFPRVAEAEEMFQNLVRAHAVITGEELLWNFPSFYFERSSMVVMCCDMIFPQSPLQGKILDETTLLTNAVNSLRRRHAPGR